MTHTKVSFFSTSYTPLQALCVYLCQFQDNEDEKCLDVHTDSAFSFLSSVANLWVTQQVTTTTHATKLR